MPLSEGDEQAIDHVLRAWRQGDVSLDAGLEFFHLADLSRPHSPASMLASEALAEDGEPGTAPVFADVRGVVMLSQTCDVVPRCCDRPFVEFAPLIERTEPVVEETRRLKRPGFAYVPGTPDKFLVADLDRMGHLLMENANALIVDAALTRASGTAERETALAMLERCGKGRRATLGADNAHDAAGFVDALRDLAVTPHNAVDGRVSKFGKRRATRIDRGTTRHPGYATSQPLRERIEEGFGWIKTTGGLAKTRHRGLDRVGWMFPLTAAAYNLVRLPKLLAEAPT